MVFLSWPETHFAGVVLAGLIGGYLMAIAGMWAGKMPGLTAIDIADFGRRYIVSDRPSAWYFGMISHLANSVIFTLFWAALIEPNLSWFRPLEGLLWGEFLAIFLAGALVAPMSGLGFLGRRTGTPRFAMTNVLLHAIWGISIGLLYSPEFGP
jgi:hypothetical protein